MLLSLLIAIAPLGEQRAPEAPPILVEWIEAVRTHVPGEPDGAAIRIAALTNAELERLRTYAAVLSRTPERSSSEWLRHASTVARSARFTIEALRAALERETDLLEFWRRAALLHTDAVLVAGAEPSMVTAPIPRGRQRQQARRGVLARTPDGRLESFELANLHWDFAKEMLAILPNAMRDPIVPLWYRAIGAYFARESNFGEAQTHFAHGRRMAPDNAHLIFGEACLQESLGAPRVQAFVGTLELPNGLRFLGVESAETHFRNARALFEQALAADSDFVEARLRLARVLIELDEPAGALPHLTRVLADASEPRLIFFAHMFAGDALLALDRVNDARASYAKAVDLSPRSHAARTALSYASRAGGDRAAAVAILTPTLNAPADDDPWWQYYLGDSLNLPTLLEQLRAPHRRPMR
jgi:tetratricopeptide (TPR) repeat protein